MGAPESLHAEARQNAWKLLWQRLLERPRDDEAAPTEADDPRPTPLHPPIPLDSERGEGAA